LTFRRAYDAIKEWRGERADVEYVRILHLAASTYEADVESALEELLAAGDRFDYAKVREAVRPEKPLIPVLELPKPDLGQYDKLLTDRRLS